jgi:predicted esterase
MNALSSTRCLALFIGCACTTTDDAWSHENNLSFDGRTRTYSIYVPAQGEIEGLMVVLHGSGQSVEHMISEIAVETTADQTGVIVVVPAGIDDGWNDEDPPGDELADDVGFIDALVTELQTEYPSLPSDHIFAHGFSNGGGLATRLACESSQIRGIGVVGNYYVPISGDCPRPTGTPIPGWFGAGVEDELVQVDSVRETMASYATDLTDCPSPGSLETVEVAGLSSDVVCKQLSGCDSARLCEYADYGHEMLPGSFEAAWQFLSEAVESRTN